MIRKNLPGSQIFIIFVTTKQSLKDMKLKNEYKVREMAGEHVVIMQGRVGRDMTRIISLNESSLYLWQAIDGKDFDTQMLADLLVERYDIDRQTALADAGRWVGKLTESGLVEI